MLFLTYHQVRPAGDGRYLYSLTPEQFTAHLNLLAPAAARQPPAAAISFDDGHASVYEHALPQLEARGTKATFFITAGWTDTRAGFLRRAQLAELSRLGHSIQSHGWSHAFLPSCGPAQLRQELVQPKQLLEDHLGQAVTEISMPAGRWNRRVLAACRDAGYQRVFTSDAGAAPRHLAGIEVLGRYMARRRTTAAGIAALLASDPSALRRQWLRRVASRSLQALLGTPFYHRLWLRWSSAPPEAAAEPGEPHPR